MEPSLFLYRVLAHPNLRTRCIRYWHDAFVEKYDVLIQKILLERACVVVFANRFSVFGTSTAVSRSILHKTDAAYMDQLVKRDAFKSTKKCINGEYEYAGLVEVDEHSIVTSTWRRQLVRDLAWLIESKKEPALIVSLIVALQTLMMEYTVMSAHGAFIRRLHAALQGRCRLDQIICGD